MNNLEDSIKRLRPFSANYKEQVDFNNSKLVQNGSNITNLNKLENKKFVFIRNESNVSNSSIFINNNNTIINNNDVTKCQKINPINELNNEDSYIKDLTKIRKFALNEIESPE
jgi:hypothetical protein